MLVPLVYGPPSDDQEAAAVLQNYWEQVQTQVAALETALGSLQHIYHESLTVGGDEGLEQLGATDQRSHRFIRDKCEAGAALEATEDLDALLETLDLQRCMMIPLASPAVAARLQEWYAESNRRRYEHIAGRIDGTLEEDAVGLLMISDRHQVQFPGDIEVFYVAPPALDDFRRWMQNWLARQQNSPPPAGFEAGDGYPVDSGDPPDPGDPPATLPTPATKTSREHLNKSLPPDGGRLGWGPLSSPPRFRRSPQ